MKQVNIRIQRQLQHKSFPGVKSVRLASLTVPSLVQNGTVPFVILTCPYYPSKKETEGIVLKWYLNSKTIPIYQWIPPSHPQGLGKFKGHIDLDFEISSDPYTRHRALYILNPIVEMSGEYTCKVSTVDNEVSLTSRMVVYAPPRNVILQSDHVSYTSVKISCLVDHTFPRPEVVLFKGLGRNKSLVQGATEEVSRYQDRAWRIILVVVLNNTSIEPENLFTCDIVLPHTNYKVSKTTVYSPGKPLLYVHYNLYFFFFFSGFAEVVAQLNTYNNSKLLGSSMFIFIIPTFIVLLLNN